VFSVTVFSALLGSGFQRRSVLGFCVHLHLSAAAPKLNYLTSNCRAEQNNCQSHIATDGQSVNGAHDQSLLLFDRYGLVFMGRLLWREDGSVFCICWWPMPVQSLLGPSPLGVVTIVYSLRSETSLFVAYYDSQGYGGDIRPHLHMGTVHSYFQLNSSL
jgi:hypothetical protein